MRLIRRTGWRAWGNFPNPDGYTDSKKIHAYFEGEFVKRNLSRQAVAAGVGPYQSCSCSIEDQTRTLLLASLAQFCRCTCLRRREA
jgi:hypothetical protein